MTPDDIEQAGRLLLPAFREAVRTELDKQTETLTQNLDDQTAELEAKIAQLSDRVTSLEKVKARVFAMYGAIVAIATFGFHLAKEALFGKR